MVAFNVSALSFRPFGEDVTPHPCPGLTPPSSQTHISWKPWRHGGLATGAHLHSGEQDVGHATPHKQKPPLTFDPAAASPLPGPRSTLVRQMSQADEFPRDGALFWTRTSASFVVVEQVKVWREGAGTLEEKNLNLRIETDAYHRS